MKRSASLLGLSGLALLVGCSSTDTPGSQPSGQGGAGAGAPATTSGAAGAAGGAVTAGAGGMSSAGAGPGGASGAAGAAGGNSMAGSGGLGGSTFSVPTVTWPSMACQTKTAGLLAMMSKKEKAAQMVMAGNASGVAPTTAEVQTLAPGAVFSPGGSPPPMGNNPAGWAAMVDGFIDAASKSAHGIPILYGVDAVHGMNAATGTVIFPHNAGLGSSRDPALVQEVARVTASEAAAMGVSWTFAPVVSVSFDDRWGRVYESFSEDPTVTGLLSVAATMGLQGATGLGSQKPGIVACGKHWAGDGQATAGFSSKAGDGGFVDRSDIKIDDATMRKYGIAPYLDAIKAGIGSIMVSDATWNGASLTGSKHLITDILKTELGFKGFVATDWNAADTGGGIVAVVNAGVDILMQPADWKGAIDTINAGVEDTRINDAVTRILNVKCEAGLFGYKRDTALMAGVGSAEHRAVGRKAVQESLVVLQNNNAVLPLVKTAKIWLTGSGSNSLKNQTGGWTIGWQGDGSDGKGTGDLTTGTTIKAAIMKAGVLAASQAEADVVVVVLSESPYAEFKGDRKAGVNTLPPADFQAVDDAHNAGKKVVAIVVSGRPVLITDHLAKADAWVAAWLPGTEGDGVADILFGTAKPIGKLSHSWPKTDAQVTVNFGDVGYDPLFKLGFGLTYP